MDLIKIGGAVLKNEVGFARMMDVLNNHSGRPLIVVISAFSSATRDLGEAALLAEQGNEIAAIEILDRVMAEHSKFAEELLKDQVTLESLKMLFDSSEKRLADFFKGLSITGEMTPRTLDAILSFGEFFALHTVNHFLQEQGFDVDCIDSTSLIVSDDNYGNAKPLIKETTKLVKDRLLPLMERKSVILTQGFVAKTRTGEITTMGIESSNLTAVLLAEILDIDTITIWTDVEGLRTADPKLIEDTGVVSELSYRDAYRASVNGLKLIHPGMIGHAESKGIKLIYKSAFEPNGGFTYISKNTGYAPKPLIIEKEKLVLAEIECQFFKSGDKITESLSDNLIKSNNVIFYSQFPDSLKLIFMDDRHFEKKLNKVYDNIKSAPCSLIVVINSISPEYRIKIQDIILNNRDEILTFDFSRDIIRIVTTPGGKAEVLKKIHKTLFITDI